MEFMFIVKGAQRNKGSQIKTAIHLPWEEQDYHTQRLDFLYIAKERKVHCPSDSFLLNVLILSCWWTICRAHTHTHTHTLISEWCSGMRLWADAITANQSCTNPYLSVRSWVTARPPGRESFIWTWVMLPHLSESADTLWLIGQPDVMQCHGSQEM